MYYIRVFLEKLRRSAGSFSAREIAAVVLLFITAASLTLTVVLLYTPDLTQAESMQNIINRDILRVGIRPGTEKFAYASADGDYAGLEAELARRLAEKIFGDDTKVEFVPVDFTTRTSKLRTGAVDCVIALCENKYVTNMLYTRPYYTDAVGIISAPEAARGIEQLKGKRVGGVQRPGSLERYGSLDVLREFGTGEPMNFDIRVYSAVADMVDDILSGKLDAFAIEGALMSEYSAGNGLYAFSEAIGTLNYSIVVPPDNEALKTIADDVLKQLEESGELYDMWSRNGLADYGIG